MNDRMALKIGNTARIYENNQPGGTTTGDGYRRIKDDDDEIIDSETEQIKQIV